MRVLERGRELLADAAHPLRRHRPAPQCGLQCFSANQFHRDERDAVRVAHFMDRADVGMVQCASAARLMQQSGVRGSIGVGDVGEELERHLPAQPGVEGTVDDTACRRRRSCPGSRTRRIDHQTPESFFGGIIAAARRGRPDLGLPECILRPTSFLSAHLRRRDPWV